MAHLRKQIRDRIVTDVTGLSTTGSRVHKSRVYPVDTLPCLCVYTKNESIETETLTVPRTQIRTLSINIDGYATATSNLDDSLDQISLEVEEAIAGDVRINNLAKQAQVTAVEVDYSEEGEKPIGMIRITIEVEYVAIENDLENAL